MRVYDSFGIQTSGLFKHFSNSGDPLIAFDPDAEFGRICTLVCDLFDRRETKRDKLRPTLELGTAVLNDGTEMTCMFLNDTGTPDWIRSSIAEYVVSLLTLSLDSRLYVGATEFEAWYGDRPSVPDFSNDLLFILADKNSFGDDVKVFEEKPYGWKFPSTIPIFLKIVAIDNDGVSLAPYVCTQRIIPFSFRYTKKELFKMCAHREIIINASAISASTNIISSIKNIQ